MKIVCQIVGLSPVHFFYWGC